MSKESARFEPATDVTPIAVAALGVAAVIGVAVALATAARTQDRPVDVRTAVAEGPAAQVLLTAATGAELLVVGSRGHGAFAGMLLGSVSQHCVQHAPCAVVVIPDGDSSRIGG